MPFVYRAECSKAVTAFLVLILAHDLRNLKVSRPWFQGIMGGCNFCYLPRTTLKQQQGKVLEGTQLFADLLLCGRVVVTFPSKEPWKPGRH